MNLGHDNVGWVAAGGNIFRLVFFTAVVLGTRIKLEILATHLLKAAKRIFGIPDFRLYALADGIREVCARSPAGARNPAPRTRRNSPSGSARVFGECPVEISLDRGISLDRIFAKHDGSGH